LRDFLIDRNRANKHFLDASKHHMTLLVDCLKFIRAHMENGMEGGKHLDYACQNWCHHFSLILSHEGILAHIESCLRDQMKTFMINMQQKWLKLWIYKLGDFRNVQVVNHDCRSALERMAVCLFPL
jgi:hypothetical protein